ncbi:MAG: hypothetical protein CMA72_09795 [Euryarchaeota archaeon]|nr:hypothetical protein [Euryarchaeota archaeon]|tara:strand:- start:2069 stop:3151 length:1083 start_codon:yes stop_codon:yes gene_type:complete
MDMKTFIHIAPLLPADQAVLMRGPTGIGKSAMAKAIAQKLDIPMIDVRTAVMDEGTMGGIPNLKAIEETGVAHNSMYGWFVRGCKEPVLIFLDEINRAMLPVLQGAFQLVLDREMGNGPDGMPYKLHPGTRILAAGNFGAEYESEDLDPAMQRRFMVVDLKPSTEDWLEWSKGKIDDVIREFIRNHPVHLRVDPSSVEPGTICPNPAVWDRVSVCLTHAGMAPRIWAGGDAPLGAYSIAMGLVGPEAAIALVDFTKNFHANISVEDVLNRWEDISGKAISMPTDARFALADSVKEWVTEHKLTKEQAANLGSWAETLGGEELVNLWTKVSQCGNLDNIKAVHGRIGKAVVASVQKARAAT